MGENAARAFAISVRSPPSGARAARCGSAKNATNSRARGSGGAALGLVVTLSPASAPVVAVPRRLLVRFDAAVSAALRFMLLFLRSRRGPPSCAPMACPRVWRVIWLPSLVVSCTGLTGFRPRVLPLVKLGRAWTEWGPTATIPSPRPRGQRQRAPRVREPREQKRRAPCMGHVNGTPRQDCMHTLRDPGQLMTLQEVQGRLELQLWAAVTAQTFRSRHLCGEDARLQWARCGLLAWLSRAIFCV